MGSSVIGDRELAGYLAHRALVEIRHLAVAAQRDPAEVAGALGRIHFLSNLCHDLPLVARTPVARRFREANGPRERAMAERPMSWVWQTAGPEAREWILRCTAEAEYSWTPPSPLPP